VNRLQRLLTQKEGQYQKTKSLLKTKEQEAALFKKRLNNIEQAEVLLKKLANKKQHNNIKYIETICTNAINAIFEENIEFKIELTGETTKTGYKFYIIDKDTGNKTNPKINEAGGLKDILGFSLRVALWGLQEGKKCNTIILDEPFGAFNSAEMQKAGDLIKELSEKLGIQFIIVTHKKDLFVEGFGNMINITKRSVNRC
jgi:DNA repair exonuclease SbcCD ATPase subunit